MTDKSIKEALAHRKWALRIFLLSVLVFFVLGGSAFLVSRELWERATDFVVPVMFGAWLLAVITMLYLHNARCPKCGNRFAYNKHTTYFNTFTSKCLNCDLGTEN
jgi:Na+/alanine symporter